MSDFNTDSHTFFENPCSANPSSAVNSDPMKQAGTASFKRDDEYIRDILSKNIWRKAVQVDGELRWTDESGTQVGELVPTDGAWKMRSFGEYMLLAPEEEVEQNATDNLAEFDADAIKKNDNLYRLPPFWLQ
jgi:hypothetical protein